MQMLTLTSLVLGLSLVAAPAAMAQNNGSAGMAQFQAGYGSARYTTARPNNGSTRDANGNRLVVNGLIQNGASSYTSTTTGVGSGSTSSSSSTLGGSTAIGNSLNVVVVVAGAAGSVVVNSTQTNTGNVQAGTNLNKGPNS